MKNKIINSTIGTISKDLKLPMKTISQASNTINTMKVVSEVISNSVATCSAIKN